MTDIVERLRSFASNYIGNNLYVKDANMLREAAAEIERLRSHIQLHAGDTLSLDNEVTLMRDHWQEAEETIKELRAEIERLRTVTDEMVEAALAVTVEAGNYHNEFAEGIGTEIYWTFRGQKYQTYVELKEAKRKAGMRAALEAALTSRTKGSTNDKS